MNATRARWILPVTAVLLGSAGVISYRSSHIDRAWREMIAACRAQELAIDARDQTRPVLHGESIEGLAFDEYKRAEGLLSETAYDDWITVREATILGDGSHLPLRHALVTQHADMLAALALGARHRDGRFPVDWEKGWETEMPKLMTGRTMVNIAVLSAQERLDAGDPEGAVDQLLDGMQYGRDQMRAPTLVGTMVGAAILDISSYGALVDRGILERLPAEPLARLAHGLEVIDEGYCLEDILGDGETALFVRSVEAMRRENGESTTFEGDSIPKTWRYGFSERLVVADYVAEALALREAGRAASALPWPEVQSTVKAKIAAATERGNPVGVPVYNVQLGIQVSLRSNLTRLRMLRAAVEYRLTGKALELDDPFGSQLRLTQTDGGLRIASTGPKQEESEEFFSLEIPRDGN